METVIVSLLIWIVGVATGVWAAYHFAVYRATRRHSCPACNAGRPVACEEHEGTHPYDPRSCVGAVTDGWVP